MNDANEIVCVCLKDSRFMPIFSLCLGFVNRDNNKKIFVIQCKFQTTDPRPQTPDPRAQTPNPKPQARPQDKEKYI